MSTNHHFVNQMRAKTYITTYKTPLARWLFENDVSLRDGARLFKTNRQSLSLYARGLAVPLEGSQTRDLIATALLGGIDLESLTQRKGCNDDSCDD